MIKLVYKVNNLKLQTKITNPKQKAIHFIVIQKSKAIKNKIAKDLMILDL